MRVTGQRSGRNPSDEIARLTDELAQARAAVSRLEQIFHDAPIGVASFGPTGQVEFVNQRVLDATGFTGAAELQAKWATIVHPDDQDELDDAVAHLRNGRLGEFHLRLRPAPDQSVHVQGSFVPTFHEGRSNGAVALFRDVTHEHRQDEVVSRFKAIAEATTDIVGITTLDGTVVYLNPAGQRFLGVANEDPPHLARLFEHIPREYHGALLRDAYQAVMRGEVWQGDIALVRAGDLARLPMSAVVVGVRNDADEVVALAATYRDLSERHELEARLAHAAAHDSLTGLANRKELFSTLETSLASGAPTAVLFFDLDDFKVVNDSLGHAVGDLVLSRLADRIRAGARGTDVVGRLGGDEFLVICRGVSRPHEATKIAENILASVRQPMEIGERQHFVTGSIGIALSGRAGSSAATLIQEADIAMYCAKRAGRRQSMLFDDSMVVDAVDRLEQERELRVALEHDEFEVYFQPIVHFDSKIIRNFEALIRWNHPRRGLLSAAEFLSIVEQVGLTSAVGLWVFAAATRAVAAMRLIEPQTCVGVNVHPDQIRQAGFVDGVTRCMLAARITGEALLIEITEHVVMVDVDQTRRVLEELQAIGVSVAIDDFGTGYSNLDLLRRLPVDYLKIDRSFVAGLGVEPGDSQLVRMIIGLSNELGIKVIAEGVETALQESELARLGCKIGQGYLYARPMSFDDAIDLLRNQQARPPSSVSTVPVM